MLDPTPEVTTPATPPIAAGGSADPVADHSQAKTDGSAEKTAKSADRDSDPKADTKAEEAKDKPAEPAKPDPFGPKFAALSKQEHAITVERKTLDTEKAELAKEREQVAHLKGIGELFKTDILAAIEKLDLDPRKLIAALATAKPKDETTRRLEKLEADKKAEAEGREKKAKEEAAALEERRAKVLEVEKANIAATIASKPDEYELLLLEGAEGIELVWDLMDAHYTDSLQKTGRGEKLPYEKAAAGVEAYLLEQEQQKLAKSKKLRSIAAPPPVDPKLDPKAAPGNGSKAPGSGRSPTLSSTHAPSTAVAPAGAPPVGGDDLDARRKRAEERIRNLGKQTG